MKYLIAIAAIALTGCGEPETSGIDQCMRVELFQQCMSILPAGPKTTMYNDWDEVVDSCESAARLQSIRKVEFIKPECLR